MNTYRFEDFKVGTMMVNGHEVQVAGVYRSGELRGWSGYHIEAAVDGGEVKAWRVSRLCQACGVEYAKTHTGKASGTKVVTHKSEEDRIAAKARLAYKDAAKGLEAMEAAGLLSGDALAKAKKDLEGKIETERKRLTKEAVAEKAKKAEEAKAKKRINVVKKVTVKAAKALDIFGPEALAQFLEAYIETRGLANTMKVVKTEVEE